MKTIKKGTFLLLTVLGGYLYAAVGCMDNSWHLKKKYDYKEYHHVHCTCPCEQQYEIMRNGRCFKCKHLRQRIQLRHVQTNPSQLINIEKLKNAGNIIKNNKLF